jgi:hypothetical protein
MEGMNTLDTKPATRFNFLQGMIVVLTLATLLVGCASYGKLGRYREQYAGSDEFFAGRGVPSFQAGNPAMYMYWPMVPGRQ